MSLHKACRISMPSSLRYPRAPRPSRAPYGLAKQRMVRVEGREPDRGACFAGRFRAPSQQIEIARHSLGNGVTVAQQTLTLFVLVRIQVPQPAFSGSRARRVASAAMPPAPRKKRMHCHSAVTCRDQSRAVDFALTSRRAIDCGVKWSHVDFDLDRRIWGGILSAGLPVLATSPLVFT